MDLTDAKRNVVLTRKLYNPTTRERVTITKPKLVKKRKVVVARGYRSMSYDRTTHCVGDVLVAKAAPLRFAIRTLLERHGISTAAMNFKTMLARFHTLFVGPIDEQAFVNNVSFKLLPTDNPSGDVTSARNQTAFHDVTEVVDAVVNRFAQARERYDVAVQMGENPAKVLSDDDVTMGRAVGLVKQTLLSKERADHYVKATDLRRTVIWLVAIGLIFYLLR